jgi:hypothetical protein
MTIARWVYNNGDIAGHDTDTLPGGIGYYVPMKAHGRVSMKCYSFKSWCIEGLDWRNGYSSPDPFSYRKTFHVSLTEIPH